MSSPGELQPAVDGPGVGVSRSEVWPNRGGGRGVAGRGGGEVPGGGPVLGGAMPVSQ